MSGIHLVCGYSKKQPEQMRHVFHALQMRKMSNKDLVDEPSTVLYQLYRNEENRHVTPSKLTVQSWWNSLGKFFFHCGKQEVLVFTYV